MKKFLALAVLATTASSFAASDSAIYDIQYLPKAGTTFGFTDFSLASQKYESKSGGSDTDFDGWVISQTVGHSITDRLSLNLNANYSDVEADPSDSGKFDYQKGFSDLNLNARFRLMDEAFRIDLIGGVRAALSDKELDEDGYNNSTGQHGLNIGAQFGQKFESVQWSALARYDYNFEGDFDVKGNDELDTINSYSALHLQGDVLNKLAEKSFLRSFVSVNFAGLVEVEEPETTWAASATTYTIGTQYQHLCTANLLLKGGLAYNTVNQDSGYQESLDGWTYTVGANYQF